MIKQKLNRITWSPPTLTFTNPTGEPKEIISESHIRLLGRNFQNNLSRKAHLLDGKKAVLPAIRRKLGALRHIGTQLPRKSRPTLVNRIVMSKVHYLIQVWGGAPQNLIKKMQIVVNNAARFVHNGDRRTHTRTLMEHCGWLYVHESIEYFQLISLWNLKWRNTQSWYTLPLSNRSTPSLPRFKTAVRRWILQKRPRPPDWYSMPPGLRPPLMTLDLTGPCSCPRPGLQCCVAESVLIL